MLPLAAEKKTSEERKREYTPSGLNHRISHTHTANKKKKKSLDKKLAK